MVTLPAALLETLFRCCTYAALEDASASALTACYATLPLFQGLIIVFRPNFLDGAQKRKRITPLMWSWLGVSVLGVGFVALETYLSTVAAPGSAGHGDHPSGNTTSNVSKADDPSGASQHYAIVRSLALMLLGVFLQALRYLYIPRMQKELGSVDVSAYSSLGGTLLTVLLLCPALAAYHACRRVATGSIVTASVPGVTRWSGIETSSAGHEALRAEVLGGGGSESAGLLTNLRVVLSSGPLTALATLIVLSGSLGTLTNVVGITQLGGVLAGVLDQLAGLMLWGFEIFCEWASADVSGDPHSIVMRVPLRGGGAIGSYTNAELPHSASPTYLSVSEYWSVKLLGYMLILCSAWRYGVAEQKANSNDQRI